MSYEKEGHSNKFNVKFCIFFLFTHICHLLDGILNHTTGNVTFGDINLSSNKSGGVGEGGRFKGFFLLFQRRYTFSNLCEYSWRNVL